MGSLILEATEHGLTVSAEELRRAGVAPGRRLELVPLPGSREIVLRALGVCARRLGDALEVGEPEWEAESGSWEVALYMPEAHSPLGRLFFDIHGELIADRSATREALLTAYYASRSEDSPA